MSVGDWDILRGMGPPRGGLERAAWSISGNREVPDPEGFWAPPVDIHERDDALVLLVDLPGLSREEIDLRVDGETLTLQGERTRMEGVSNVRLERPVGRFRRSFRIGVPIDPAGVQARHRDGVLTISIPKATPRHPQSVRIEAE